MAIENIYIREKLVGEEDYRKLAVFFGETLTDAAFWNLVLAKASETDDSKMRWIFSSVITREPEGLAALKEDRRSFFRAKRFVHAVKRQSGRAKGPRAVMTGVGLFLETTLIGETLTFLFAVTLPGFLIWLLMRLAGFY